MNDQCLHHINPTNPLNINIEFNIHPRKHLEAAFKSNRIDVDQFYNKNNPNCQPSRTPELPQTDRNTYQKELDSLGVTEAMKKKKSKRNSMDINTQAKLIQPQFTQKNRAQKGLLQTQIFKKVEPKKKRSYSKYQGETFRKTLGEGASKSAAIEARSDRKAYFNPSLKNIIHKIVNNELSKRSLGISFSKGKSPYHLNNAQLSSAVSARKKQKKKNLTCKSVRQIKRQDINDQSIIVQKLNSLKSMTNSILRSEADQPEMPYYSKKKGPIHIHTDRSIDLIEEISYYEKKTRRDQRRKEAVNQGAIHETTQLIENYIQMMAMESEVERKQSLEQLEQQVEMSLPSSQERQERSKIRNMVANEMHNLFQQERLQSSQANQLASQKELRGKEEVNKDLDQKEAEQKMRPFLSSEMARGGLNVQLQRLRLQELKRQEIQKWGYLLQFIKKNMGSEEADTQSVLNEVYWYLQKSKNDLQKDLAQDGREQKPNSKELDEQFTVKYSENRLQSHEEFYQDSSVKKEEQPEQEDEDVASFRQDYNNTEENENLKMLNLETISSALKQRKKSLLAKREKQLQSLDQQRELGKITQNQLQKQKERVEKWTKKELEEISKANNNIWRGYRQAKGVLDKTICSKRYEEQTTTGKMMKCLSQTYLRKHTTDYIQALKPSQKQKSKETSSFNAESISQPSQSQSGQSCQEPDQNKDVVIRSIDVKSDENEENGDYGSDFQQMDRSAEDQTPSPMSQPLGGSQELTLQKSQEMQAIKQRLLKMKQQHFLGEQQLNQLKQNVNYEQIQRSLEQNYEQEQMAIINREVNNTANSYNKLETKLKYCCAEDKQDIFQFIFLDLCIELYQQPCKDNRIMKSVNAHVTRAQAQAKKKKGVKTNLNVVKQYLKRFSSFLVRTNRATLNNLNSPMGPTAIEMLRYMHDGDYDLREEEEEVPTLIIPINAFEKFQQSLLPTLEFQQYYDDPEKEEARVNFLKTILHIHNKALFDSLNEFLDHERPFSIWGAPFPWKKASSFHHKFTQQQQQQKLKKSSDKVIEQCSYVCGLLVDKQQSLVGNAKISDTYIQQIRQDRLSRMLANQLVESEQRWLFYDDEQTEVLVELATFIWNSLLIQARNEISMLCRP